MRNRRGPSSKRSEETRGRAGPGARPAAMRDQQAVTVQTFPLAEQLYGDVD